MMSSKNSRSYEYTNYLINEINMELKKNSETSVDKHGYKLCSCGCNLPLVDSSHPNWPKGWKNNIGPDGVPEGFSNGLHGPAGPEQITDTQVSLAKVIELIDTEKEFDGEMPDHIFDKASVSPEATALALRIACRSTKQSIKRRLRQLQVAVDYNLDSDAGGEEARALHRVVRAMHDGHCPSCGYLAPSDQFYQTAITNPQHPKGVRPKQHCCPRCSFTVTEEEAELALARFRPYLEKSVKLFLKWRNEIRPAKQSKQPQQVNLAGGKGGCNLTIVREEHSRLCQACSQVSATLYAISIGQANFQICPFCKANIRQSIERVDGPEDCY